MVSCFPNSLRMQLTQLLFNTQANSNKKVDTSNYEKPLTIPAGSDSFDGILKSPPKACIHARKHTCACIIARTHAHTNTNTCKRMCAHMISEYRRISPNCCTTPYTRTAVYTQLQLQLYSSIHDQQST